MSSETSVPVVDASVVAAASLVADVNRTAALRWLDVTFGARTVVDAPALILPELASAVQRATGSAAHAADACQNFLESRLFRFSDVTLELCEAASLIARQHGLKGCDAVYVALARHLDEPLVSFDREQLNRARNIVEGVFPS